MVRLAPLGRLVAVHAENDTITRELGARARAQGRRSVRDYLDSRPAVAETEAIARAIELAAVAGCPLHIVHVSTGRGVALVAEAAGRGIDVTCEVTAHHLALTDEDAERLGAVAKCAPPLRPAAETATLWEALGDGRVSFVVSDHSPASRETPRRSVLRVGRNRRLPIDAGAAAHRGPPRAGHRGGGVLRRRRAPLPNCGGKEHWRSAATAMWSSCGSMTPGCWRRRSCSPASASAHMSAGG